MKIYKLFIVIFLAFFAGGCTPNPPAVNQNAENPGILPSAEINQPAPVRGPADTLKALSEASNKKDVAAIKKYLSMGTLALLETGAREQNKTVDEALREDDGGPFQTLPEMGAAKIEDDKASLEVRNVDTGEFENLPFVKENGEWKVAIDVYLNNLDTAAEDEHPEH